MESSWYRARKDTKAWLLGHIYAWFLAFLLPGGFNVLVTWLSPPGLNPIMTAFFSTLAGLLGLLILLLFTLVIQLLLAPYKQRNEARKLVIEYIRLAETKKKVPLPNRESLIRSIAVVRQKAFDLRMAQDDLNFKERKRLDTQNEINKRDIAWDAYIDAREGLNTELLIAGDNFKAIIGEFMLFVDYHVHDYRDIMELLKGRSKPKTLKTIPFMTELDYKIEQAIRHLDSISLQLPDKGDSQN